MAMKKTFTLSKKEYGVGGGVKPKTFSAPKKEYGAAGDVKKKKKKTAFMNNVRSSAYPKG